MPSLRSQSQSTLVFPVTKAVKTRSRKSLATAGENAAPKSCLQDSQEKVRTTSRKTTRRSVSVRSSAIPEAELKSPGKRGSSEAPDSVSPPKQTKNIDASEDQVISVSSPKRMAFGLLSNQNRPSPKNPERIPLSPVALGSPRLQSPNRQARPSGSRLDVYSPVKENCPTPVKSPSGQTPLKGVRALTFSPPRPNFTTPDFEDTKHLRVRTLNFSPSKQLCQNLRSPTKALQKQLAHSPLKHDFLRVNSNSPIKSPLVAANSPRKSVRFCGGLASPEPNMSEPVRCSPRKHVVKLVNNLMSPEKIRQDPVRCSPRKHNVKLAGILKSPEKTPFDPVRCSPRKHVAAARFLTSPLRLAKQEGLSYQRAKQALHTALPDRILCRENEMAEVNDFVDEHLGKKTTGSLYISGAPGTGKTAVLSTLRKDLEGRKCQVVYLNCMSLKNSQAIYNKVLSELTGKATSMSCKMATRQLEKVLVSKGKSAVLILDEVDSLDSKNQEVLYTMFEWPALNNSRAILIGIANALDLTDRILPRLQARPNCKPKLLHFSPYTREQIVTILKDRLEKVEVDGHPVMEPTAIQFCARKVAAVAGDMRKALDVCRRAVEMVEVDVRKQQILKASAGASPSKAKSVVPKKISVAHIHKIVNEVYGSGVSAASNQQQTIPLQQKLAICTLLLLLKHGKGKVVNLGKFHETYTKICRRQEVPGVDQSEFLSLCSLIEARGILQLKKAKETRMSKISLKLDEREVEFALQDKLLMSQILQNGLP